MGILEIQYWKVQHQILLKTSQSTNKIIADLQTKLKHFEKHENYLDNIDYKIYKQQLEKICEKKIKRYKYKK